MDPDPLLPSSSSNSNSNSNSNTNQNSIPQTIHHLISSTLLYPLPEYSALPDPPSPPPSPNTASSFKDRLIFGPHLPPASLDFHSIPIPLDAPPPPPPPPPSPPPAAADDDAWLRRGGGAGGKSNLHRSRTAPAMAPLNSAAAAASSPDADASGCHPSPPKRPAIVLQAFLFLLAYLALGVAFYAAAPANFASSAGPTHPVADALYFCIVTLCTIGYGDITPATPAAKLFSISFVLVGFGFVDILLSGMVSYVLDLQEHLLIAAIKNPRAARRNRHHYIFDVKKGRMRVRMKVALALAVVALCVGVGAAVLRRVESLGWLDAVYLAVMSVTTVGYGDHAFRTLPGRLFASAWLLVSTLAVARAFLYLAEMRIDKRHRAMANWVLSRDMTVSEFLAADIDQNGYVTRSEFAVYKLKEMGKVSEKDLMLVCDQFDRLDTGKCGKITLSDLLESHHLVLDPKEKKKRKP